MLEDFSKDMSLKRILSEMRFESSRCRMLLANGSALTVGERASPERTQLPIVTGAAADEG